jgi:hypothetical protein
MDKLCFPAALLAKTKAEFAAAGRRVLVALVKSGYGDEGNSSFLAGNRTLIIWFYWIECRKKVRLGVRNTIFYNNEIVWLSSAVSLRLILK